MIERRSASRRPEPGSGRGRQGGHRLCAGRRRSCTSPGERWRVATGTPGSAPVNRCSRWRSRATGCMRSACSRSSPAVSGVLAYARLASSAAPSCPVRRQVRRRGRVHAVEHQPGQRHAVLAAAARRSTTPRAARRGSGAATTTNAVPGACSSAYVCSARSRKPPNIVSSAATNVCRSVSSCAPRILVSTPVTSAEPGAEHLACTRGHPPAPARSAAG